MSRVVVLGLDNRSVGEFEAVCTLGYGLNGNPAVTGGGSTQVLAPNDAARGLRLDFGRMVVIQPEDLPTYLGIIDTPWTASAPASLTVYDAEYLFHLRCPEEPVRFTGSVDQIFGQMIEALNSLEDLYVRLGNVYEVDSTSREETLDGRTYWEQVQALARRSRTEFLLRPERGEDKRWYVYVDLAQTLGIETGFELSDGENGNMRVARATVRGEIVNRMVGINSTSGTQSRLSTDPLVDTSSQQTYRTRNRVVQWRDVSNQNTLTTNTQNTLDVTSRPYLELTVEVRNRDHCFRHLRQGNRILAHAAKIVLPGGRLGWRGMTRITKMAFNEATATVSLNLIGAL